MFFLPAPWHCWWSHVETASIHGAVISSYWDQWHAWSRPFSFAPTDPLFSPIQPWWLLSHHCLHPPLVAQWTPVGRPVSQTDFYLLRSPQLVESLLLPIFEVAEWLCPLICTLPLFPLTLDISLSHFSDVTKVILCLCYWTPYSFLDIVQASRTPCWPSLSKSVMNRISTAIKQ